MSNIHPPFTLLAILTTHRLICVISRDIAIDNIIAMVKEATLPSVATIRDRIYAANWWRHLAEKYRHSSQLDAARETLNLLDLAVAESTT